MVMSGGFILAKGRMAERPINTKLAAIMLTTMVYDDDDDD